MLFRSEDDHRLRGAWLLKQGFVREALEFGRDFLHQLDSCMLLNGAEINIRGKSRWVAFFFLICRLREEGQRGGSTDRSRQLSVRGVERSPGDGSGWRFGKHHWWGLAFCNIYPASHGLRYGGRRGLRGGVPQDLVFDCLSFGSSEEGGSGSVSR